ncbi:MAG: hypothetical protein RIT27_1190 [Pseudomonadota bacterium]|jgi:hypothetical protein
MRCTIFVLAFVPLFSVSQVWGSGSVGATYCPYGANSEVLQKCTGNSTRRLLPNSSCEYRARNGEITQGKVMQTVDNKNVCVINLSDLKQVGESCQLGIYNGWNPLRNWQVSGTVSQQNNALICSVSEIPAEPQLPRPPLPTKTQLLNLQ